MKATDAAGLLTICAAYDNRRPDADQAKAWAMVLDGIRFEDARDAIVKHYRDSRDWIMPADVIKGVKRIRGDRVLAFGPLPDPPAHIDPDNVAQHGQWLSGITRAIADGTYVRPEPDAPAALEGKQRDVIRELGQAGQPVERIKSLRAAQEETRRRMADAKAEQERKHEEQRQRQQAARQAARAELRGRNETPEGEMA